MQQSPNFKTIADLRAWMDLQNLLYFAKMMRDKEEKDNNKEMK